MPNPSSLPEGEFGQRRFRRKLAHAASRLGEAALAQILTLYYVWTADSTPWRSKALIAAALAYFVLPLDAVPDFLVPFGFSDDLAVIATVYTQVKAHISDAVRQQARQAAQGLLRR